MIQLCCRFHIDSDKVIADFKALKASGGRWGAGMRWLEAVRAALSVVPVSTAECERSFSVMNTIASPKRNRLTVNHLSDLMFISIMGPPLTVFNPTPYSKSWLQRGNHSAGDTNSVKRQQSSTKCPFQHIHYLLG